MPLEPPVMTTTLFPIFSIVLILAFVLFVGHLLHPVDDLAALDFMKGRVGHRGSRRCAVPVLLPRGKPDDVTGADFLDRTAFPLHPANSGNDDKGLAERMRVPRSPGARFKGDVRPLYALGSEAVEKGIDPHRAGEPVSWPAGRGHKTCAFDFHGMARLRLGVEVLLEESL